MHTRDDFPHHARIAVVMLFATLCAGCVRPLASQHEFFSPASGTADRIGARTQHVLGHHRALQTARNACGATAEAPGPAETASVPAGPHSGLAEAREALAELCASGRRPPVAAYGGVSNAYRRWAEDQVRPLPAASETAASAAGGS